MEWSFSVGDTVLLARSAVELGRSCANTRIKGFGVPGRTRPFRRPVARAAVTLLASLLLGTLVASTKARPLSQSSSIDEVARSYVRLAVALGERDSDSIDYYYGPAEWVADIRKNPPPLEEIRARAAALSQQLNGMHLPRDGDSQGRKEYLLAQLHAVECRADLLSGAHFTFDQESACFFGVTVPARLDRGRLSAIRSAISRLLGGHGDLARRYAIFDEKYLIPPERLPAVMARAIEGCREQTAAHLPLPPKEHISVEYVPDEPWSGYSLYQGHLFSRIEINPDLALTVDRALDLACHETYPGHHTFTMLEDISLVKSSGRPEFLVQPTFSPQSLLSEASATLAGRFAFPEEDRIRFEGDELFPLAGLRARNVARYVRVEELVDQLRDAVPAIARDYLDGKLEFARASEELSQEALMTHSFETLKYLNEYRSYALAYTYGVDMLAERFAKDAGAGESETKEWREYQRWMTAGRL